MKNYYISDEGVVINLPRAGLYPVRKTRHEGGYMRDILMRAIVFLLTPVFLWERGKHGQKAPTA
jgi:hypothetical protein